VDAERTPTPTLTPATLTPATLTPATLTPATLTPATLTRRTLLAVGMAAVGTAGVAVLAGCSNGSKVAGSGGGGATDAGSTDAGSTATTGGAGGGASGSTATVLAKVADVPVGNAISATLAGKPILISQPAAGMIVVFTAICTHQGCTVAPAGKEFHCPCHGSIYDAATGAVKHGPAPAALAKIPTHVVGGDVMSGA
jgi:Rieske Fe-S protein